MPPSCTVGAVIWEIEERVRQATYNTIIPNGCPQNWLCVSVSLCSQVIHWAHISLLSCHPVVRRTCFIIKNDFGGPPWRRRWDSSQPHVSFVLGTRPLDNRRQGSCAPFQCPITPCLTSPWNLSRVCPLQGQIFHDGSLCSSSQVALNQGNGRGNVAACILFTWVSEGHGFRPGAAVCIPILAGFLLSPVGCGQPHLWVSSPVERPN